MKHHHAFPLLMLLGFFIITATAFAQSLPPSMAYSSSILLRNAPVEASQKLLISGNSLTQGHRSAFDLSEIPAVPDSAVRNSKVLSSAITTETNAGTASLVNETCASKLHRSMVLMGVLAIAYLTSRKRASSRMQADISKLRNFRKKRLAHHEAHA